AVGDFQKDPEFMIDFHIPEHKHPAVLRSQPMTETTHRAHIKIVENDNGPEGRITKRSEQGVFALGRIWRAIDQYELCSLKRLEYLRLRSEIERLDQPSAVPQASERNDVG